MQLLDRYADIVKPTKSQINLLRDVELINSLKGEDLEDEGKIER